MHLRHLPQLVLETLLEQARLDADALEQGRDQPVLLLEQGSKEVLGEDLLMIALAGDRLGLLQGLLGLDGKLIEFHGAKVTQRRVVARRAKGRFSLVAGTEPRPTRPSSPAQRTRGRTSCYCRPVDELAAVLAQARAALKSGDTQTAVRLYRRAQELSPRDPELPHERGLALLETGDIGLAALAQAEALALDPEHTGARAQRAAALEALGDDEGAARELDELLHRIGPQPALQARYIGLGESARRARERRLLGNAAVRLATSPLASALARTIDDPLTFRAPFAELRGYAEGALLIRLDFAF